MVVDVRAFLVCNLGRVIRGELSDDLMIEGGLIRTTGTIELEGLQLPLKGTRVELAYYRPQQNSITRFPRRLRVLRAFSGPYANRTTLEVGCKLALLEGRKEVNAVYRPTGNGDPGPYATLAAYAAAHPPIPAQDVLLHCLQQVGIELAPGSQALRFRYLRPEFDLSNGYLAVVSELLKSECCYAFAGLDDKLNVRKIDLTAPTTAPVLSDDKLIDLQAITGGDDPAENVQVIYNAIGG